VLSYQRKSEGTSLYKLIRFDGRDMIRFNAHAPSHWRSDVPSVPFSTFPFQNSTVQWKIHEWEDGMWKVMALHWSQLAMAGIFRASEVQSHKMA
jgi:hypothetical protein